MEEILTRLMPFTPDMLLLQEVVPSMYDVLRRCLPGWSLHRWRAHTEDYFLVNAVRTPGESADDKTTVFQFVTSNNGRHLLTTRRRGWVVVNAHAESGTRVVERDERAAQLLQMSRLHEHDHSRSYVIAGDLNHTDDYTPNS